MFDTLGGSKQVMMCIYLPKITYVVVTCNVVGIEYNSEVDL